LGNIPSWKDRKSEKKKHKTATSLSDEDGPEEGEGERERPQNCDKKRPKKKRPNELGKHFRKTEGEKNKKLLLRPPQKKGNSG